MAQKVGDAYVNLGVKDKAYTRKMGMASKTLSRFGSTITKVLGPLAALAAGAGAVRAFAKQEQAVANLTSALKQNGDEVSTHLPRLEKLASSIQKVTTAGDEETLMLMAQIRNLGVQADAVGEATKGAIGLAAALDLDTKSAARYTALALQGETTILQRYVPALRTATSAAEKQRIVLDLMSKGFQQAQDQSATAGSRFEQLKNALGDLGEAIIGLFAGGGLESALEKITRGIQKMTEGFNALANSSFWMGLRKMISFAFRPIQAAFDGLKRISAFLGAVSGGSGLLEAAKIADQMVNEKDKAPARLSIDTSKLQANAEQQAAKARIDAAKKEMESDKSKLGKVQGEIDSRQGRSSFVGFADAIKQAQSQSTQTPLVKLANERNSLMAKIEKHQKKMAEALEANLNSTVMITA